MERCPQANLQGQCGVAQYRVASPCARPLRRAGLRRQPLQQQRARRGGRRAAALCCLQRPRAAPGSQPPAPASAPRPPCTCQAGEGIVNPDLYVLTGVSMIRIMRARVLCLCRVACAARSPARPQTPEAVPVAGRHTGPPRCRSADGTTPARNALRSSSSSCRPASLLCVGSATFRSGTPHKPVRVSAGDAAQSERSSTMADKNSSAAPRAPGTAAQAS